MRDQRWEVGKDRQQNADGRRGAGYGEWEMGDGMWDTSSGRQEVEMRDGDRRRETRTGGRQPVERFSAL